MHRDLLFTLSFLALCPTVLATTEGAGARITTVPLDEELSSRGRLGGVAVDAEGYVYVSDFRSTVWRISPGGEVDVLSNALRGSSGNAVDGDGNLYQASFLDGRILRIDAGGAVSDYVSGGLDGPVGLTLDGAGNLFVCNCRGNYLSRVPPNGRVERFAESPDFDCPNGVTVDSAGNLVVASFNNGFLVRVTPDGTASRLVEIPEGRNAHVVAVGGDLYVTKIESNRIFRLGPDGAVTAFAGTGELGLRDGAVLEATLSRPNGIAVTSDRKTLYVNNLEGPWRGSEPTTIVLRRIELR